jgi:hypothetical protein
MSNLGFLLVHAQVNARPGALCERAFLPGRGGRGPAARLAARRAHAPAEPSAGTTLESGRPLWISTSSPFPSPMKTTS